MNGNSENSGIMLRGLPSWALSGSKASGAWPRSWDNCTVQINLLLRTRVRGHQFVVTVREINRFYMQCKIMSYSWIMISFLYDKVVVSKSYFNDDFNISVSWAVIYRVVNITTFLHEWVGVLVFIFQFQHIARFHYFLTTQLLMSYWWETKVTQIQT